MKPITQSDTVEIALKGAYILTEMGSQYCIHAQIPVRDIRNHQGQTVHGFVWAKVESGFLERFVTHGLLEGIEISRTEFLSKRKELIRLVSCIFDGILLKRFRPELNRKLRGMERISQIAGRDVKLGQIQQAMQQHQTKIKSIKETVLDGSKEKIENRTDISNKEKNGRKENLKKLFEMINDEIWFLYAISSGPIRQEITSTLLQMLASYVDSMDLSGFVPLIVMEFIQYAEAAHLLNLAERDQFLRKSKLTPEEILSSTQRRERLIERAQENHEFIVFSIDFSGNPHDPSNRLTVTLSVRNKGIVGYSSRKDFLSKKVKDVKTSTFETFVAEMTRKGQNDHLGLMYLSSLQDLCKKQGMVVDALIIRDERQDETVSSLKMTI